MCVCMHEWVYICGYAYVYVCVYVYVHEWVYVCECVCVCMYVNVCMCVCFRPSTFLNSPGQMFARMSCLQMQDGFICLLPPAWTQVSHFGNSRT